MGRAERQRLVLGRTGKPQGCGDRSLQEEDATGNRWKGEEEDVSRSHRTGDRLIGCSQPCRRRM